MDNFQLNKKSYPNVEFINPVGYIDSITLQKNSIGVITDSGGIQKEAYMLEKKCITLRSETEWVETLVGNWNQLIFENLENMSVLLNEKPKIDDYNKNAYGDGNAAVEIVNIIKDYF